MMAVSLRFSVCSLLVLSVVWTLTCQAAEQCANDFQGSQPQSVSGAAGAWNMDDLKNTLIELGMTNTMTCVKGLPSLLVQGPPTTAVNNLLRTFCKTLQGTVKRWLSAFEGCYKDEQTNSSTSLLLATNIVLRIDSVFDKMARCCPG